MPERPDTSIKSKGPANGITQAIETHIKEKRLVQTSKHLCLAAGIVPYGREIVGRMGSAPDQHNFHIALEWLRNTENESEADEELKDLSKRFRAHLIRYWEEVE